MKIVHTARKVFEPLRFVWGLGTEILGKVYERCGRRRIVIVLHHLLKCGNAEYDGISTCSGRSSLRARRMIRLLPLSTHVSHVEVMACSRFDLDWENSNNLLYAS